MIRALKILTFAALSGLLLSACTDSDLNKGPVGTGKNVNEMKGSPCACMEIPMTIPVSVG